jgi:hypothetical protein
MHDKTVVITDRVEAYCYPEAGKAEMGYIGIR